MSSDVTTAGGSIAGPVAGGVIGGIVTVVIVIVIILVVLFTLRKCSSKLTLDTCLSVNSLDFFADKPIKSDQIMEMTDQLQVSTYSTFTLFVHGENDSIAYIEPSRESTVNYDMMGQRRIQQR